MKRLATSLALFLLLLLPQMPSASAGAADAAVRSQFNVQVIHRGYQPGLGGFASTSTVILPDGSTGRYANPIYAYDRDGLDVEFTVAHETGHIFDWMRLTPALRLQWMQARGISSWQGGLSGSSWSMAGKEDFATCFAHWSLGPSDTSPTVQLSSYGPCPNDQKLMSQIINAAPQPNIRQLNGRTYVVVKPAPAPVPVPQAVPVAPVPVPVPVAAPIHEETVLDWWAGLGLDPPAAGRG